MALITLIRHGQASFGAANYDQLSPKGFVQSRQLGELFAQQQQQFDRVYMGAMVRHQQTAETCLQAAGCTLKSVVHAGFNEFDHEQVLMKLDSTRYPTREALMQAIAATEHPKKTLGKLFGAAMQRWQCGEYDCDYTETWQQFQARSLAALNDIVAQSVGQHSVVFSSGGVISVIVQALMGLSDQATFALNWSLVNCGMTQIRTDGRKHSVLSINEHNHFRGQASDLLTWH
ncbi:MAG: histidine phosphatase family protein [Moraxellaceae bacterium]|nr:MAG: histidine phosphatase family protein [Moraxellaceae bacterium]